ncbi:ABC transporter permease [Gracilibacillus alcaliphilus]|uniref:ABC transporter permease n=1 Tax=Gracilibacillus alcaliphilus TaxID=1401441 RepID=UPI0019582180|nr:ABC transporter permease [Gracilibacillus alcaliphilus]MBM7677055.1 ABC-2 type transport system permease protein [Gracilibacillus alcaliphilus]
MFDFWIKDMKLLWRDPTELLVILLMPFILITILGFALGGFMNDPSVELDVAVVDQDDERAGIERIQEDIEAASLPMELSGIAQELAPKSILLEVMEEDLSDVLTVTMMTEEEANQALEDQEVEAVMIIPETFTYESLQNMLLGVNVQSTLTVTKSEDNHMAGDIFQTIIEQFANTMNVNNAFSQVLMDELPVIDMEEISRQETVMDREPISSMEYYTLGMAAMFALFIASTMAAKTHNELNQKVVNRILLSGKHPLTYLIGKVLAVIVLVWIQVCLLLGVSSLVLRTFQPFETTILLYMFLTILMYGLAVGALASLLIALTVRFEGQSLQEIFSIGLVTILSFLGGSFFPAAIFPSIIQILGEWTPNGITMKIFMLANQGMPFADLLPYIGRLSFIIALLFAVSVLVFPKRRLQT